MFDALSSDILERQFGPTEVAVMRQDGMSRIIYTSVPATGQILELSHVMFDPAGVQAYKEVHRTVMSGVSMGKAFRRAGVAFMRRTRTVSSKGPDDLPAEFTRIFGSPGQATVVEVSVLAGPSGLPYAEILEVYSPAVAWPEADTGPHEQAAVRLDAFGALLGSLYTDDMGTGGIKDGSWNQVGKVEGPVSKRPRT